VSEGARLRLFEAVGIEVESMIVDGTTLDVRPVADAVLEEEGGAFDDVERGAVAWSNELVLHVLEMKTNGPARTFAGLAAAFEESVARLHAILAPRGARLLGTGMHPWMDPGREKRLWPHGNGEVYAAFDRIFDCRGHGWSNLQSVHLNLPFADDAEFGRLHAAVRVLLPVLPALAASSPAADGRLTGMMDTRLEHYRLNSRRVPSVTGAVVPERVFTRGEYEERILGRIYADMAPLDRDGILRHEWANARGAIARFDRGAVEIRLLDSQECPRADLAVAAAVTGAVRALVEERLSPFAEHSIPPEEDLAPILAACMEDGGRTAIADRAYLRLLGWEGPVPCTGRDLWAHLAGAGFGLVPGAEELRPTLDEVLRRGTLAERIASALGPGPGRADLERVYRRLADRMRDGEVFSI
jgi:gamma-glutamyl:cysteine ligase YbdK (ATP-grasp superfamily)